MNQFNYYDITYILMLIFIVKLNSSTFKMSGLSKRLFTIFVGSGLGYFYFELNNTTNQDLIFWNIIRNFTFGCTLYSFVIKLFDGVTPIVYKKIIDLIKKLNIKDLFK